MTKTQKFWKVNSNSTTGTMTGGRLIMINNTETLQILCLK
jgi:hypothetical protein